MEGSTAPIYLDYNATTPLDPRVIEAITMSLKTDWGNPSSGHVLGQKARDAIDQSREQVASMINALTDDIVFLSGGTEANHAAIHSAIFARTSKGRNQDQEDVWKPHVVVSNLEHDSVLKPLKYLQESGDIELSLVLAEKGVMLLDPLLDQIKFNTCLVSVMHANNETGVIMPIKEIGNVLKQLNKDRKVTGLTPILFHCDAAQSIGKIKVDVQEMGVDYLTIVGHKFYGPRIGALYVRGISAGQTPIISTFHGGGQERGFRHGTENTPMIVGLGEAASVVSERRKEFKVQMRDARDTFESQLLELIPGSEINFRKMERLPNTLSFRVPEGLTAEQVLTECKGKVLTSLGAACHSNSGKPSEVLLASGLSEDEAIRTMRISVGRSNISAAEINIATQTIADACKAVAFDHNINFAA